MASLSRECELESTSGKVVDVLPEIDPAVLTELLDEPAYGMEEGDAMRDEDDRLRRVMLSLQAEISTFGEEVVDVVCDGIDGRVVDGPSWTYRDCSFEWSEAAAEREMASWYLEAEMVMEYGDINGSWVCDGEEAFEEEYGSLWE